VLITRDCLGLVSLIAVPIVVIVAVAGATQFGEGSASILFPVVNDDRGPAASALIKALREHIDVREVSLAEAKRLVADQNVAAAALVLPRGMSKRYLREEPSTLELLTDPAKWRELQAIKIVMLLADRETASLADPFHQELIKLKERSITADRRSFSSLEQNIPGFSLMFVLLTLTFSVPLDLREEEVWGTSGRLSVAPVSPVAVLTGKLMARLLIGTLQLLILLLFGHLAFGLALGNSPFTLLVVATVIVFSMTCFALIVAGLVRTREQIVPIGLAIVFVLAVLGGLFWPLYDMTQWMRTGAAGVMTTWSMYAVQDVILRGRGLIQVAPKLAILTVFGLAYFLIGLRLFRYEHNRIS